MAILELGIFAGAAMAGEYDVTITNKRTNNTLGNAIRDFCIGLSPEIDMIDTS